MTTIGRIDEFEPSREDWTQYTERLTQFLLANDIDDNVKKRAVLLSMCGSKTYAIIRSLLAPTKPTDKSFEELIKLMTDHYNPAPSVIVQRFKFHTRQRNQGESVATFVAELRALAEHCRFEGEGLLEDMLRDRLVCGISDANIQRRLLSVTKLDFKKAKEIAIAMEQADRSAQDIKTKPTSTPTKGDKLVEDVNYAQYKHKRDQHRPASSQTYSKSSAATSGKPCHRCGGNHAPSTCKFKDSECHFCQRKGHIQTVCRSKLKSDTFNSKPGKGRPTPKANRGVNNYLMTHDDDVDELDDSYSMYHMIGCGDDTNKDSFKIVLNVNKKQLTMEIDTGASVSVISEKVFRERLKGSKTSLKETSVSLHTYTGDEINILGQCDVHVKHNNQYVKLPLIIVKGDGPSLLGRNWMHKLRLNWKFV